MIHFFMPFNNLSGSCVALYKLFRLSSSHGLKSKIYSTKGYYEDTSYVPELRFNVFSHVLFFFKSVRLSNKNDILVFNTYVCFFSAFLASFFRKSYLYLHEDISDKVCLIIIIKTMLHISPLKLIVVNPELLRSYPKNNGIVISNFYFDDEKKFNFSKSTEVDYLMISNALPFKGVFEFVDLARRNPIKSFVLITNKLEPYNNVIVPKNLLITTNQDLKIDYISKSRFIVNLSIVNETFGLTTFEGVCSGLFPITFENAGSRYMLGENYIFLKSINDFEYVSSKILQNSDHFSSYLEKAISKNFSSEPVLEEVRRL